MRPAPAPDSLALVRHGESAWIAEGRFQGRGDPPLSELGARQASAVARRLAAPAATPALPLPAGPPHAIWHSPLMRAASTAARIHEARSGDAPLFALDALTELGQGEWEGLPHEEVRARYPDELAAWRRDPLSNHAPGGESLAEAIGRARDAVGAILGGEGEPASMAAEGGGAITAAEAEAQAGLAAPAEPVLGYERRFGPDTEEATGGWSIVVAHDGILRLVMFELLGIDASRYWSFPFGLCAITVLDRQAGVVRLRAHNLDAHLSGG